MQPHKMGDINPLDLLATAAASLHSASVPSKPTSQAGQDWDAKVDSDSETTDEAALTDDTFEQDIKANLDDSNVTNNNNLPTSTAVSNDANLGVTTRSASLLKNIANGKFQLVKTKGVLPSSSKQSVSVRDATKLVLHDSQTGKNLTVLKINKPMPDHSYAFVGCLSQSNGARIKLCNEDSSESVIKKEASVQENVKNISTEDISSNTDNSIEGPKTLITENLECQGNVSESVKDSSKSVTDKNVVLRALLGGSKAKPYKVCLSGPSTKATVLSNPQVCNQKLVCVPDDSKHIWNTELVTQPVQNREPDNALEKDVESFENNYAKKIKPGIIHSHQGETISTDISKPGKEVIITGSVENKQSDQVEHTGSTKETHVQSESLVCSDSETRLRNVRSSVVNPLTVQVREVPSGGKHNVKVLLSPVSLTSLKPGDNQTKVTVHRDSIDSGIEKDVAGEALQTSDYETDHCWQHSSSDESCDVNASSDSEIGSCIVSPTLPSEGDSVSHKQGKQHDCEGPVKLDVKHIAPSSPGLMSPPPAIQYVVKSVKGNHKTVIPVKKYKYIIEDDIPPTSKFNGVAASTLSKDSPNMVIAKCNTNPKQGLLLVSQPNSGDNPKSTIVTESSQDHLCTSRFLKPGQVPGGAQLLLAKPLPVVNTGNTLLQINPSTTVIPQGIIYKAVPKQLTSTTTNTLLLPKLAPISVSSPTTNLSSASSPVRVKVPVKSLLPTPCALKGDMAKTLQKSGLQSQTDEELLDVIGDQNILPLETSKNSEQPSALFKDCVNESSPVPLHGTSFAPINDEEHASCDNINRSTSTTPLNTSTSNSSVERWTINGCITGRETPLAQTTSFQNEAGSPPEKINVKIASSKIVEVSSPEPLKGNSMKSHKNPNGEYKTASIGTLGSISWTNLSKEDKSTDDSPCTKELLNKKPVTCAALSEHMLGKAVSEKAISLPRLSSQHSVGSVTSSVPTRVKRPYNRKKPKVLKVDIQTVVGSDDPVNNLHPLIDHDYCAFTSFSAVVQSSIIATTELKFFKKHSKKKLAKAKENVNQRTGTGNKSVQPLENQNVSEIKPSLEVSAPEQRPSSPDLPPVSNKLPKKYHLKRLKKLKEKNRLLKAKKKILEQSPISSKKDKNYVKITGSFQDDFVYYAAKSYRKKPRKFNEHTAELPQSISAPKLSAVGGLSVFDWYKDLSKADKSTKFGLSESDVATGSAALHDTDVVDLVYEMEMESETNSNAGISDTGPVYSEKQNEASFDSSNVNSVFNAIEGVLKMSNKASVNPNVNDDSGIFSPGDNGTEAESIERPSISSSAACTMPMNTLLSSYVEDPSEAGSNQLCDLDEINDSDLFSGDLNNMTDLLGEVASSSTGTPLSNRVVDSTVPSIASSNFSNMLENGGKKEMLERIKSGLVSGTEGIENGSIQDTYGGYDGFSFDKNSLDRSELFPDMSQPEPTVLNDVIVPELTVVSMYWNDLPGLVINGKQYVRLVDIHKQMLPAKDTGILKKRCQMLGLEIASCTEMQRDFLIRYANAAKSKSCVITSRLDAESLIGFYVEPRPKTGGKNPTEASPGTEKEPVQPQASSACAGKAPGLRTDELSCNEEHIVSATGKKRNVGGKVKSGGKSRRNVSQVEDAATADTTSVQRQSCSKHESESDVQKRSERLRVRHKKISYAKLHEGGLDSSQEEQKVNFVERKEKFRTVSENVKTCKKPFKLRIVPKRHPQSSNSKPSRSPRKLEHLKRQNLSLENEIAKLKLKARKRSLGSRDRQHFLCLKDRIKMLRKQVRQCQNETRHAIVKPQKKIKVEAKNSFSSDTGNFDVQSGSNLDVRLTQKEPSGNNNNTDIILRIVHVDNVRRSIQRCRSQEGDLLLHMYKSKFANCVQCTVCRYKYNIYKFMKHLHHPTDPDEMYTVTLPQRIELAITEPNQTQMCHWQKFLDIRRSFEEELAKPINIQKLSKETLKPEMPQICKFKVQDSSPGISLSPCDLKQEDPAGKIKLNIKSESRDEPGTGSTNLKESNILEVKNPDSDLSNKEINEPCSTKTELLSDVRQEKKDMDLNESVPKKEQIKLQGGNLSKIKSRTRFIEQRRASDTPNSSGMRHSSRVRKRKQYHPIESYVFNQGVSVGPTPSKSSKSDDSVSYVINESPTGISREF